MNRAVTVPAVHGDGRPTRTATSIRPSWLTRAARIGAVASAAVLVLAPVNFVQPAPVVRLAVVFALAVGVACFCVLSGSERRWTTHAAAAAVSLLLISSTVASHDLQGVIGLIGPVMAGLALGYGWRDRLPSVVAVLSVVNLTTLAADAVLGPGSVSGFFGTLLFAENIEFSNRPRGFLGQAVPAGMVAACCFVLAWVLHRRGEVNRRWFWLVGLSALAALWLSGTRSALLVLALSAVVVVIVDRSRRRTVPAGVAVLLLGVTAAATLSWRVIVDAFVGSRLFAFSELAGSVSLGNRQLAPSVLALWPDACEGACRAVGQGPRALQSYMQGYFGTYGVSTVDNMYVTALWDFGILGAVLLVISAVGGAVSLHSRDGISAAAAAGAVVISLSGFLFDSVYVQAVGVLLGLLLGVILVSDTSRAAPVTSSRRVGATLSGPAKGPVTGVVARQARRRERMAVHGDPLRGTAS